MLLGLYFGATNHCLSLNVFVFVFFSCAALSLHPHPALSLPSQKRRSTTKARGPGAKVRVTKGKAVGARATTVGPGGGKRSMAYRAKVTPALSGQLTHTGCGLYMKWLRELHHFKFH